MNMIIEKIAESSGIEPAKAESLIKSLADVLKESLSAGDSIAIPGFGTFMTEKEEEQIVENKATGSSTLIPPRVNITFIPALRLAKAAKSVK